MTQLTFQAAALPDPEYVRFQAYAGGDVRSAIWRDWEHLVRVIACHPPWSVMARLSFRYRPTKELDSMQDRLGLFLAICAARRSTAEQVASIVCNGHLRRYYGFQKVRTELANAPPRKRAICDVVRRTWLVPPLHSSELNPNMPRAYFAIESFKPNKSNDFRLVDQVLGSVTEDIDVSIAVEPADVSSERTQHLHYIARLHAINHEWDDHDLAASHALDSSENWRSCFRNEVRPLRQRAPLADEIMHTQQRFHRTFSEPHVRFCLRVSAESPATALIVGSVLAESMATEGTFDLITESADVAADTKVVRAAKSSCPGQLDVCRLPWEDSAEGSYRGLARLATLAPVSELVGAFRLPVASHFSPCCIRKNTDPARASGPFIVFGHDEEPFGDSGPADGNGVPRGIPTPLLNKHIGVFGMSGVGKTTEVDHLLIQFLKEGIACLVLQTAKSEYRMLKRFTRHPDKDVQRLAQLLKVYTIGDDPSPFRFNPMDIMTGVQRDEHIENLIAAFQAAMPMPGPLLALIGEALERVYDDWSPSSEPPTIVDAVEAAKNVMAEGRYVGELKANLWGAMEVRLGNLTRRNIGRVFQCRRSVPAIAEMVQGYSVIEMDRLPPEQKCLLTRFILGGIHEYLKTAPDVKRDVRFVIVIEEAHNVIGKSTQAGVGAEVADPKAHSAAQVCAMLLEFRSLGVPVVIVDQHPSNIAPEVLKGTTTKLGFRQCALDDRTELGATMLFGETELEEIARLGVGEAFFFTEGFHKPRRIRTVDLHAKLDLRTPLTDDELRAQICREPWFRRNADARLATELAQLRERMDEFDRVSEWVMGRTSDLLQARPRALALTDIRRRRSWLARLRHMAKVLRRDLLAAHRRFKRGPYRTLLPADSVSIGNAGIKELRAHLVHRCEHVIGPGVRGCVETLDRFIQSCSLDRTRSIEHGS